MMRQGSLADDAAAASPGWDHTTLEVLQGSAGASAGTGRSSCRAASLPQPGGAGASGGEQSRSMKRSSGGCWEMSTSRRALRAA
jgi:hypothetical protein